MPRTPAAQPDAGRACVAGEVTLEGGGCRGAGVAACAQGFASDGAQGCRAVLPETPCPKGSLAQLGEAECHSVGACGAGDYGDAPSEPGTQYVNAASAGGASDGSRARPWPRVQQGLDAAAAGAVVAVAAGRYSEDLVVRKAVRLVGRCAAQVEIVGVNAGSAAVYVTASNVTMRDFAVRGAGEGVFVDGARDVVAERLWIHDTSDTGFDLDDTRAVARATLRDSLVEATRRFGVVAIGSELEIERTVIRDVTVNGAEPGTGHGLEGQNDRRTRRKAQVNARSIIVERAGDIGIALAATDAVIEAALVRDTKVGAVPSLARGLLVQGDAQVNARGSLVLTGSVVERSAVVGIMADAADATLENVTVRDVSPSGSRYGIGVIANANAAQRTVMTMRASLVERAAEAGVIVAGADGTLEGVIVRDVAPIANGTLGQGIIVEFGAAPSNRSVGALRASVVERAHEAGILVYGSDAEIEGTAVRGTRASTDGSLGDGIAVIREQVDATAKITRSRVEGSARAGVSAFGGAVTLGATVIECNQLALVAEEYSGAPGTFDNQGQTVCRCGAGETPCAALSSRVVPPKPPRPL